MKKEKFEYVYSFKYNNKEYIYITSKNYPFYFLEYDIETNSITYPNINIFKELYDKFYNSDNKLFFKHNLKGVQNKLLNKNINIIPLIRTASGLISLVIALSLCGCTQINDVRNQNSENGIGIIQTQDKNQEIINYFKNYNMQVINKEYNGNDYIFVKEFINSNNKHQITLQNFEEFRKYNNINFVPNWNDVINEFQNNKNIDQEKRTLILECINNMKNCEELKNMDLSVLYVNAKKMKFKYISTDEMINNTKQNSVYAYFDVATGIVYLPNDKPIKKFEFIHEVLGHGSLSYRDETENSLIIFDCTNYIMLPTDKRYTGFSMGTMVSEGGANMIAHLATKDYSVSTFYELYEEELRIIANFCNVSIGELFNCKGISLYDLMYKNGIDTPIEYIFKMDGIIKGQIYCDFSELMERLLIDATEEKVINSSESEQNEIIESTIKVIRDSYFKEKEELKFNYEGGTINYNFEDSAIKYEENINKIKINK